MILNFTGRELGWAIANGCFNAELLGYQLSVDIINAFKNDASLTANHALEVSASALINIYDKKSQEPEGQAATINKSIKNSLLPQIFAVANWNDYQTYKAAKASYDANPTGTAPTEVKPNEGSLMLEGLGGLDARDTSYRDQKILNAISNVIGKK